MKNVILYSLFNQLIFDTLTYSLKAQKRNGATRYLKVCELNLPWVKTTNTSEKKRGEKPI